MASFANMVRDKKSITFEINDVDTSVVNSIRRLIFTHIPAVGFYFKLKDHYVENDMKIVKNDSPLHNEFLAHRLSLIPLNFTEEEIENWSEDDYKFIIKGELTNNQKRMDITTEHFEIFDKRGTKMPKSFVQRIFPPDSFTKDYILLTVLRSDTLSTKSKLVHIELTAKKGIPIDCACWQSASTCVYYNTIDEEEASKALKALLDKKDDRDNVTKEFNTLQKYRHFKKNHYGEPNSFTMTIESECAMKSERLFLKAIHICIEMLQSIQADFSKESPTSLKVEPIGEIPNFYLMTIHGHTHTIGNLLQSLIMNRYVREEQILEYIGYSVPHPLENSFIMKIKFKNDISMRELHDFMIKAIQEIVDHLNNLVSKFEVFM